MRIPEIIKEIQLNGLNSTPENAGDVDYSASRRAYSASFEGEGERKVSFVLEDLRQLVLEGRFDPGNAVALSIGGADGSDLRALLQKMPIRGGVLLEYAREAAAAARAKADLEGGQRIEVVEGDATQKKGEAVDVALNCSGGAKTVIVMCFGVLHELPTRSPDYREDRFFDIFFSKFESVLLYCAEPCAVPAFDYLGWPDEVEIRLPDLPEWKLRLVADHICLQRFGVGVSEDSARGGGWVVMRSNQAVEVLHKLIRFQDMQRFRHEMGERLTSFNGATMGRAIQASFGVNDVEMELMYRTSTGFRDAYREHGVEARASGGQWPLLPPPITHCRLILRRLRQSGAPLCPTEGG
ncbi:hypothetical protein [Roseospira visakhapatnamensis]|uniref:Histidine-specific methyltransferase SAM-dependent domain-containing protein n=1 Tax=Roseospira visakhapatnamensis TaxID=390880 RepID=A0A7W6RG83_9PROT|nr:hypothetical protein [Roseospira visakhapatnamensis]MBB4268001.1 hypothetical protein [Roseospira visakhapatnamensis]